MTYNIKRRVERLERASGTVDVRIIPDVYKKPVSVALSTVLLCKLDEYAKRRDISRSAAISIAVSELLMRDDDHSRE